MSQVRSQPCSACPYRVDVPSGVWAEHEYNKLPLYDAETFEQPLGPFMCHATPESYCHGWAVCHGAQTGSHALLAFRMFPLDGPIPEAAVPLFSSGTEAAEHGKRDIEDPDEDATTTADRLARKYERLKWG